MENHRFRENISDKSLRQYFNQKNSTPNKRYKETDYIKLRREYHTLLDTHRDQQRVNRNKEKREKSKTPRMSISKLDKYVELWHKKNKTNNTHFEIQLRSQLNPDIKNTFKFNHINNFKNWITKVTEETYVATSESWGKVFVPTTREFYNLFENVIVDNIKFISGGCNKN